MFLSVSVCTARNTSLLKIFAVHSTKCGKNTSTNFYPVLY